MAETGAQIGGMGNSALRGMHPVVALKRLGLDETAASPQMGRLADLNRTDFPTIILLHDGSAAILLGRNGEGRYALETMEGLTSIPDAALERQYSGKRFHIAPKLDQRLRMDMDSRSPFGESFSGGATVFAGALDRLRHSRKLGSLVIAGLLSNLFHLALPVYVMALADHVVNLNETALLAVLAAGAILALIAGFLARMQRSRFLEAMASDIHLDLQGWLYRSLTRCELVASPTVPGTVGTAMQSVEALGLALPGVAISLLADAPFTILALFYMSVIAGKLVLVPAVAMGLVGALAYHNLQKARLAAAQVAGLAAKRANMIDETVNQREVLRATGAGEALARIFEDVTDQTSFAAFGRRLGEAAGIESITLVMQVAIVATLTFGALMVSASQLTLGGLAAASAISGWGVWQACRICETVVRVLTLREASRQADRLATLPEEISGDSQAAGDAFVRGGFEFRNVRFSYPSDSGMVLEGFNLTIRPGEKVGIVGRVGSGKSTLARLAGRQILASNGAVLVDGRDIRQFDPGALRREIAYMPQDCDLLDLTIRNNIGLGLADLDEATFSMIANMAGVREIAARRPSGYGFKVGPLGRRLSGGERQAVALARTLARRASVYILDEPTSAMDGHLERQVIDRLRIHLAGKTVIMISHRTPVLAMLDRVILIDKGKVVTDGPAQEIMRQLDRMQA